MYAGKSAGRKKGGLPLLLAALLLLLPGAFSARGGEYLTQPAPEDIAALNQLARENLAAIIDRRPPRETKGISPVLHGAQNGVALYVLRKGKLEAAGEALEGKLTANIRLAAGKAVYNKPLGGLDDAAVFTCLLGQAQMQAALRAPFYQMNAGSEGYRAEYKGQTSFVGPLEPLLEGWDWRQTLTALVTRLLAGQGEEPGTAEVLRVATDKDFRLEVYPARIILSSGAGQPAWIFSLEGGSGAAADTGGMTQALLNAFEWYRNNQQPQGAFPGRVNLLSGTSVPPRDMTTVGLNACALGWLWRSGLAAQAQEVGLRALDEIFMEHFLASPQDATGYIREADDGVSLGAAAAALLAVLSFQAQEQNPEIAQARTRLEAFLLALRGQEGEFRPWLRPAQKTEGLRVFPALAAWALLESDPQKHGEAMLHSMDALMQEYNPASGAQPPNYAIPWLTRAAAKAYGVSRQRAYAEWVLRMNLALANQWVKEGRIIDEQRGSAGDCALVLFSVSEAYYLQKLLLVDSDAQGKLRQQVYRRALVQALQGLFALQVRGGALSPLFADQRAALGGFRRSARSFEVDLQDMSLAMLALSGALRVLEDSDLIIEE